MSESLDLARRAVACKGWRWMPGMRILGQPDGGPLRIVMVDQGAFRFVFDRNAWSVSGADFEQGDLPDLEDPATIGCLLALVREAWGWVVQVETPGEHTDMWLVLCPELGPEEDGFPLVGSIGISGYTEAEALVAALEAAP